MGEIELPLTVSDQHPMRTEEVVAQYHWGASVFQGNVTGHLGQEVGEFDRRILDRFVADGEALEPTDPDINRLFAHPHSAPAADNTGRFRRHAQTLGDALV